MERADKLLHDRFPEFSRRQWASFCTAGLVCDRQGQSLRKGQFLAGDEEILVSWDRVRREVSYSLESNGRSISLLFRSGGLLAFDKPAGLPSHPLRAEEADSAVHRMVEFLDEAVTDREGFLLNRLDVWTSGILLSARTAADRDRLLPLFRSGSNAVEKFYTLVVWGLPDWDQRVCEMDLVHRSGQKGRVDVLPPKAGRVRPPRTRFRVLGRGRIAGRAVSVLEARLDHGQMHQVRAHSAWLGFPLVGDPVYGREQDNPAAPRPGQLLHCSGLRVLPCPDFPEGVDLVCPVPEDFPSFS